MIEQATINRFMLPPIGKYGRLYQELLKGFGSYDQLGNRLVHLAEQARAFNQFDAILELALILSNLPLKHYQSIGQYYLALTICRNGTGDVERAATIFEKVASEGPLAYRAEAMLSLSSIACINQQPDETIRYCLEAARVGNFNATIKALRGIAIIKGLEGNHRYAVNDLEKLYPMFKYAPPHIYFDYMNSLAVELGEVGRLEEARNVSSLVIASPFAAHYPEYRETYSEINQRLPRRQSVVRIGLPERQDIEEEYEPEPELAANVVAFPRAKPYIPSTHLDTDSLGDIDVTGIQLLAIILRAVLKDRTTEEEINKICNAYFFALKNLFDDE